MDCPTMQSRDSEGPEVEEVLAQRPGGDRNNFLAASNISGNELGPPSGNEGKEIQDMHLVGVSPWLLFLPVGGFAFLLIPV